MNPRTLVLLVAASVGFAQPLAAPARADGGGAAAIPVKKVDPEFVAGEASIKAKDWAAAIGHFSKLTDRKEYAADAWNWMGYAERQQGNLDAAFANYEKALAIDPKHRGAREYAGEAWLLAGNLPKAEEQLAALDKLCFFRCQEYRDLKKAIDEYKKKQAN